MKNIKFKKQHKEYLQGFLAKVKNKLPWKNDSLLSNQYKEKIIFNSSLSLTKDLKLRLTLILIAVVFIPLLFVGSTLLNNASQKLEKSIYQANRSNILRAKDLINFYFQDIENEINKLSNTASIKILDATPMQSILIETAKSNPLVSSLFIADDSGKIIYNTSGKLSNIKNKDYFQRSISGEAVFEEIKIGDGGKRPIETVYAKPIKLGTKTVGILGATINIEVLSRIISDMEIDQNQITLIVDERENVIAHSDWERIEDFDDYKQLKIIKDVIAGEYGEKVIKYNGHKYLSSYAPIEGLKWGIITKTPYKEAFKSIIQQRYFFYWMIIGTFFLTLLIAMWVSKYITDPLISIVGTIQSISEGDLTLRIQGKILKRQDQFGILANSFNEMVRSLDRLIEEINSTGETVAVSSLTLASLSKQTNISSEKVALSIDEIAKGAWQQAKDIENSARRMNELGDQIEEVSDKTKTMIELSLNTEKLSADGLEIVQDLSAKSHVREQASTQTLEIINDVYASSQAIDTILNTISAITSQTNLLSLNASIEAARAGEAGKGFAVVASEISKLAKQTDGFTKEINQILEKVKEKSKKAVVSMERERDTAVKQNFVIEQTKEIFDEIQLSIRALQERAKQVEASVKTITIKKGEIIDLVGSISAIAEETSASAEQVAAASEEQVSAIGEITTLADDLKQLSEKLNEAVHQLKI